MFTFEQTVYQIGGGTSEGTLMKPIGSKRKPENIKQVKSNDLH